MAQIPTTGRQRARRACVRSAILEALEALQPVASSDDGTALADAVLTALTALRSAEDELLAHALS